MNKISLGAFAIAALIALPGAAFAAEYAYVNQAGEVMSVEAINADTAMKTAPNIDEHSGVMLLDSSADMEVVGDSVSGT